jgi:long-chain acyl-CoA synthetase
MAALSIEGDTIVDAFRQHVQRNPERPALRWNRDGHWVGWTWSDYGRAVGQWTAGLAESGVSAGDTVAILSGNRVEWHLADFGTLSNGAVTVPVYQTSSPEQVAYVLGHAEVGVCFVEDADQLAKVLEVRDQLPKLNRIVVFEGDQPYHDPFVMSVGELVAAGSDRLRREPGLFEARADAVAPGDLATLVYTSGTTGPPKGTMINHGTIMWTLRSSASVFGLREGERFLSFLPLSHIAERMISEFASAATGGETWFARNLGTVGADLRACRPTVFFAVPRIWEKLRDAVLETLGERRLPPGPVVDGSCGVPDSAAEQHVEGDSPLLTAPVPHRALDATVGRSIRRGLGLDEAHILVSSAAPIHPDLLRWLGTVGLPVLEIYGQTETCGPTTVNPPGDNRLGTVGTAIPGESVRIAEDGEVLVRGGNICQGYLHDAAGTAELIDPDGWLHSGDMGALDDDGYLRITGRKKDLIITAAGQNIAPQGIESDLRNHELLSEAVVIGDGRRYLTALLTLDGEALMAWAARRGKEIGSVTMGNDPEFHQAITKIVDDVNATRSRVERVKVFRVLDHGFGTASGEMTQTLKVKRNVVIEKYRALVDEMYRGT